MSSHSNLSQYFGLLLDLNKDSKYFIDVGRVLKLRVEVGYRFSQTQVYSNFKL